MRPYSAAMISDKPNHQRARRLPVREYLTAANAERMERRAKALIDLQGDWLYQLASPEGKDKLVRERINSI